jgi:hypothetical protein
VGDGVVLVQNMPSFVFIHIAGCTFIFNIFTRLAQTCGPMSAVEQRTAPECGSSNRLRRASLTAALPHSSSVEEGHPPWATAWC